MDTGSVLTVAVNGQAVIEYDRRKPLASHQRLYLDGTQDRRFIDLCDVERNASRW